MRLLSLIALLLVVSIPVHAGILDATQDLEGKVVLIAGTVETVQCPIGGKYDCLNWPTPLLQFQYRNVCFSSDIGACGLTCTGLIAAGANKVPYFFVVGDIGGGITKHPVTYYKCPDPF